MLDQLVRRDDGARATGVIFEIGLEVLEDDPYPTYAWMRRELPRRLRAGNGTGLDHHLGSV